MSFRKKLMFITTVLLIFMIPVILAWSSKTKIPKKNTRVAVKKSVLKSSKIDKAKPKVARKKQTKKRAGTFNKKSITEKQLASINKRLQKIPPSRKKMAEKILKYQALRINQQDREKAAARLKPTEKKINQVGAVPAPGGTPDYFGDANWAFSPALEKFVDSLPGLGVGNKNNLNQYIPVANPDTTTYPGSDYYEIELRQYSEQMHTNLPATRLRGYVQVNNGTDGSGNNTIAPAPIHYLGPLIRADRDRPVRIKFTNKLPTGTNGNLFLPVDTTVMGAGMGPLGMDAMPMNYTQNRGTIHLHGGRVVWISDGTAHQWITPQGEDTPYPKGVSVQNVPDMPDPGNGSQTFYYSNQQSARLMFFHDHSLGITRLNVYGGEAAGYLIEDPTEKRLVTDNIIPSNQMPLIIQDKTFVDPTTIGTTDPTWDWGTTVPTPHKGDLWLPHVYVPAQNPYDVGGVNPYGRWAYGPWFWPPTIGISHPPVANPYYNPNDLLTGPPKMPGTPHPSMAGEAFLDTAVVNGTVFPYVEVDPKTYRLRILNAANDRFWNLQLYEADASTISSDGRRNTEVKMVPAVPHPGDPSWPADWPTDGRDGGVPDPATVGPNMIQIGTESGFLPKPAELPNLPVDWNADPTTFNAGNVDQGTLILGPAERADVIVDFSAFRNKTLILYNDAPAAYPARDPRLDYYTGAPDLTDTGGHPGPQVGFGPNTRTIMQIRVKDIAPSTPFNKTQLENAFASSPTTKGAFEESQDPILVPTSKYNSAYNKSFPTDAFVRIQDNSMTFKTLNDLTLNIPLEPKAIQDEMSEAFDDYGRMEGKLGLELPFTQAGRQTFVLQKYQDPTTEGVKAELTAMSPVVGDGTQIWKITHNGVDTHPIHFHAFDVQLINRVGWDGIIREPDPNELGWKETVKVSPLEDTIVALRPIVAKQPFGVPESVRPMDPTMPIGSTQGFTNIDPHTGNPIVPPVTNQKVNFGWEYMWHCHILSHEEMEMMRPVKMDVATTKPQSPYLQTTGSVGSNINLSWTDGTPVNNPGTLGNPANEIGYRIERATVVTGTPGPYAVIGTALANKTSYVDSTSTSNTIYNYRVVAYNAAGESISNVVMLTPVNISQIPQPPTNLRVTRISRSSITISWRNPTTGPPRSRIRVQVKSSSSAPWPSGWPLDANATSYAITGLKSNTWYWIRVGAGNSSGYSYSAAINTRTAR